MLVALSSPVHKVELNAKKVPENVVSNQRWFHVPLKLLGKDGTPAPLVKLGLRAQLVDERDQVVTRPNEEVLAGDTQVGFQIGGDQVGDFKIKAGPTILSSKMRTNFRIRVEPWDERIRGDHPSLSALTEPFKLVTKVNRKPDPNRISPVLARAAPQPTPAPPPVPRSTAAPPPVPWSTAAPLPVPRSTATSPPVPRSTAASL